MVRPPIIMALSTFVVDEYPIYAAPHLMYMRTPVRFGVTDGAINVTFAAVGRAGAP